MSELARIAGDVSVLQDEMTSVGKSLVEHELRLHNGRKAIAGVRTDIEAMKPKAPDWVKIMLAGLAVVGVLMGGQLWITDRFDARPTRAQLEDKIAPIRAAQKDTSSRIGAIETSQGVQEESMKNLEEAQKSQTQKIDLILERLPRKRGK